HSCEVREIEAARGLKDRRRRGEQPVGPHDAPADDGDRGDVAAAISEEHVERGAETRAEKQCGREHVYPLDDEVFHFSASRIRAATESPRASARSSAAAHRGAASTRAGKSR